MYARVDLRGKGRVRLESTCAKVYMSGLYLYLQRIYPVGKSPRLEK